MSSSAVDLDMPRETAAEHTTPSAESAGVSCGKALTAISVRGLTVSYGERPVLRSVSFDVSAGQLVGVVGPNGAGKSTLLRAILGLIPCDAGSIDL